MSECYVHNSASCLKGLINQIMDGEKIGFFVGAGISIQPPASLPAAWEIKEKLLDALNPENSASSAFSLFLKQMNDNSAKSPEAERLSEMMLEHILHLINEIDLNQNNQDESLVYKAIRLLDIRQPDILRRRANHNHFTLAHLLIRNKIPIILTTNFDWQIEDAYTELLPGHVCDRLIKLHGDIRDIESIKTTLPKVVAPLQGPHRRQLEEVLQKYSLCLVGYSGRDLDISVVLKESESNEFYWLVHPNEKKERIDNLLAAYNAKRIHIIPYDLNLFLNRVGELNEFPSSNIDDSRPLSYDDHWSEWSHELSQWQKTFVVGRLYQELGLRNDELRYFHASKNASTNCRERSLSLYRIGTAYLGERRSILALFFLIRAYFSCGGSQSLILIKASILRDIGDVVYRTGRKLGNSRIKLNILLFNIAKRLFKKSRELIEKRFDTKTTTDYDVLSVHGLILSHLGKVHRELFKFNDSVSYFNEAINIADRYEAFNYWLHAEVLIHRAKTYLKMGSIEYENILADANKALSMFKILGNDEGIKYADRICQEIKMILNSVQE